FSFFMHKALGSIIQTLFRTIHTNAHTHTQTLHTHTHTHTQTLHTHTQTDTHTHTQSYSISSTHLPQSFSLWCHSLCVWVSLLFPSPPHSSLLISFSSVTPFPFSLFCILLFSPLM